MVDRLSSYPWVIVRIGCDLCQRQGAYRTARLAARYGSEIPLEQLLDQLAADCPWRRPEGARRQGKYEARCGAEFVDFRFPQPPTDIPPGLRKLRVVGGKG